ncbi:MAG: hypothetical protein KatS3mg119_1101 [Rhodothalassiaceae bacterium]|nr:MAG: hypothetical protein KatS3mg119_1101 [Rhodothalassiaceae bacterium]
MAKPEWGKKRTCPECGTRFYDLGKDDPVTCVECGHAWVPEPVLKSKQPIPEDEVKTPETEDEEDLVDIEVDVDDDDFALDDEDDDEVPAVVKPAKDDEED